MYAEHCSAIAHYMHSDLEGFKRGAWFAICSIRQPITVVPEQVARLALGDTGPLFGHKVAAFDYLERHAWALWVSIKLAPDNAQRIAVLLHVPGLGIVKAGFVLQLMGYDVACLDSRNVKREGRAARAFRTDGKPPAALGRKVAAYLREVEGKAAAYWDAWCQDVAQVYDMTAEQISELHMAIVPDNHVPF